MSAITNYSFDNNDNSYNKFIICHLQNLATSGSSKRNCTFLFRLQWNNVNIVSLKLGNLGTFNLLKVKKFFNLKKISNYQKHAIIQLNKS